jgi:archaellum component FlaC
MSDFSAIDARFSDVNERVNHQNSELIKLASESAQLRKDVDIHTREIDAIRTAQHAPGNELNSQKIHIDTIKEKVANMSENIQKLSDSIERFIKFSYVVTGMGLLGASAVFWKLFMG